MEEPDRSNPVALAAEADFALGPLNVQPSACRIFGRGVELHVEPRVMQVLVLFARACGRTVSRDNLIAACWGGRSVSDDAINRVVAKIRQIAKTVEPAPFAIQTVPKIGYRLIMGDADIPERALLASSASRAPPETLTKDRPEVPSAAGPRRTWAVVATMIGAGIVLAVTVAVAAARFAPAAQPAAERAVVAVAPFQPLARDDVEVTRAAARLTDAALRNLSGVSAPTGAAAGAGSPFRLTGFVDRDGEALMLSARLEAAQNGLVLWSIDAGRGVSPEAFAAQIAAVLACGVEFDAAAERALRRSEAALVFRMCEALTLGRRDGVEIARELGVSSPDLSLSHTFLGYALADAIEIGDPAVAPDRAAAIATARAAAQRAVEMAPRAVLGHVVLARLARAEGDFVGADAHLRDAAAVDPDAVPYVMRRAPFLREVGRLDEALAIAVRASRLSGPRLAGWAPTVAFMHAMAGDLAAARTAVDAYAALWPDRRAGLEFTIAAWWRGPAEALTVLRTLPAEAAGVGDAPCFIEVLARLSAPQPQRPAALPDSCAGLPPQWRVRLLARLGDVDAAYTALGEASLSDPAPYFFLFYPEMDAVRRDPRFLALTRRLGLYDYWRSTGHWPDFCRDPTLPYRCDTGRADGGLDPSAVAASNAQSPVLLDPPAPGGLRDRMWTLRRFRVQFAIPGDRCDGTGAEFMTPLGGAVGDGGVYEIAFAPLPEGTFRWTGSGPRQVDCSSYSDSYDTDLDPRVGGFTLWGHPFAFDDDGWVYDNWDQHEVLDVGHGAPTFSPARVVGRITLDEVPAETP